MATVGRPKAGGAFDQPGQNKGARDKQDVGEEIGHGRNLAPVPSSHNVGVV